MNRYIRLSSIIIFSMVLASCTSYGNPFAKQTLIGMNACKADLVSPVELVRATFVLPDFWSKLKPCSAVRVYRNLKDDGWEALVELNYTYDGILVNTLATGFGVGGNLDRLGGEKPGSIDEWKELYRKDFEKHVKAMGSDKDRNVRIEIRNGLSCLRTETISFRNEEQTAYAINFKCWDPENFMLPPIGIGGWMGYSNGKPLYDIDLEKDLIDVVFATLVVKEIPPEIYAKRMSDHEKEVKAECKRRLKRIKYAARREYNAYEIERLEYCGYDTSDLTLQED